MLMVRKDSGYTAIDMLGHEQEGLDALVGFHCVFDSLSHVQATIGCFQKNSIEWASYWKGAISSGNPPSYIPLARIHAQVGLPLGIDVGAMYATAPGTNTSAVGGEVKWAFLQGGPIMPAAAIRGTYTKLLGVDDIDLHTLGLDASISKGFGPFTPYAGAGVVKIQSSESSSLVSLKDVDTSPSKFFLGAKLSFLFANLVAEADFSEVSFYSLRFNVSF